MVENGNKEAYCKVPSSNLHIGDSSLTEQGGLGISFGDSGDTVTELCDEREEFMVACIL